MTWKNTTSNYVIFIKRKEILVKKIMFVVIHCVWLDISHVSRYTTYNQNWSHKKGISERANERTKSKLINQETNEWVNESMKK